MAVLLLAEHDNGSLAPATGKAVTAARAFGGDVDVLVVGDGCRAVAEQAAKLDGVRKVLHRRGAASRAAPRRGDRRGGQAADAELFRAARSRHHHGQERAAARRRHARRGADLRHRRGEVAQHLRAAGLCRQCAGDGGDIRQDRGRHGADHGVCRHGRGRLGPDRGRHAAAARRAVELRRLRHQRQRAARADRGAHRRLRRARHAVGR